MLIAIAQRIYKKKDMYYVHVIVSKEILRIRKDSYFKLIISCGIDLFIDPVYDAGTDFRGTRNEHG